MNDLTLMLKNIQGDEKLLAEQVLPLVYDDLRRLATARMIQANSVHTLQPTALVHEAWLRLVREDGRTWETRLHFFRAAAMAMRCILIDYARKKATLKRAVGWQRVDFSNLELISISPDEQLLLIDESMQRLEREDPDSAEVVLLKFFTGLSNKDTARTLGISEATVERRWAYAKISLFKIIRELQ